MFCEWSAGNGISPSSAVAKPSTARCERATRQNFAGDPRLNGPRNAAQTRSADQRHAPSLSPRAGLTPAAERLNGRQEDAVRAVPSVGRCDEAAHLEQGQTAQHG